MSNPALRGFGIGLAVLLVGAVVLRLDGPEPWLLSRATGITAFVALSLDVALGLAMSTGALGTWITRGHAVDLHRWLSPLTLALVAGHAGILLFDRYIDFHLVDVLVPFVAPYRAVPVGLGVIAGYLALVVHLSFGLRKRIGTAWWRRLHYLSFAGFVAAAAHALLAGTDAFRPWALALTAPPVLVIVALIVRRVRGAWPCRVP